MEFFRQLQDWLKNTLPSSLLDNLFNRASAKRSSGLPSFGASEDASIAYDRSSQGQSLKSKAKSIPRNEIVKSRPTTLQERYRIVEDGRQVEAVFKSIANPLMDVCDDWSASVRSESVPRTILRELGTTDDRRSYLYMKLMSADGLLMERNGAGWRISKAEKIIGRHMFMRSHQDPWDLVTVWSDPMGEGLTRIRSHRFSQDLLSVSEYERRLTEALKDFFESGVNH